MNTVFSRQLGRSRIEVSALGMGCWAIGGPFWFGDTPVGWGEVNDDNSIRAIQRALDLGVTFFDTADVYGTGHSERILAKALAGHRQEVVIATKFGNTFDENTRHGLGPNAEPSYIRQACEASLKRLNTDIIDLYQFHLNDYDPERAGEVRDTLDSLVNAGKIRAYGWSTDHPESARVFAQGEHCTSIQHQINVLEDSPAVIDVCETFNLASINRAPLAMGLLTGKFVATSNLPANDVRGNQNLEWMPYFKEGKPNPEWLKKLEAIREILTSGGRTLAQGALGWLWARSQQTVPIPGFKTVTQVEENCGALRFGPLTTDQLRAIDAVLGRESRSEPKPA